LFVTVIANAINKSIVWLPFGPAVDMVDYQVQTKFADVNQTNDSLRLRHGKVYKLYESTTTTTTEPAYMKGPETVLVNKKNGNKYVLTEEGMLVYLDETTTTASASPHAYQTKVVPLVHLGVGRPLGGIVARDGTVYICDAVLGFMRVRNVHDPKCKPELIASRVKIPNGGNDGEEEYSPIILANDAAFGPKSGKIYFTDASSVPPDRVGVRTWDTLHASKIDYLRGIRSGRVFEYDPSTDKVTLIASGMAYANGIAIGDPNKEDFLVVSETYAGRIVKIYLEPPSRRGDIELMVDAPLPGYPDGMDCDYVSRNNNGQQQQHYYCYAPMPSKGSPVGIFLVSTLPRVASRWLRSVFMALSRSIPVPIYKYGAVMEFDPKNGEITRIIQDPTGEDIHMLTGVSVYDNKLYLGSLKNDFVTVYDLQE